MYNKIATMIVTWCMAKGIDPDDLSPGAIKALVLRLSMRKATYKDYDEYETGETDLYEWITHPEETKTGVCEKCASYNGKIFSYDDLPTIPVHPWCPCVARKITYDPHERVPAPTYSPANEGYGYNEPSPDQSLDDFEDDSAYAD